MENFSRFKDLLNTTGIKFEEGRNGDHKFVKIQQLINSTVLIVFYVDFVSDETIVDLFVYGVSKIDNPLKRSEMLKLVNEMNLKYRYVKYVISDNGDLVIQYTVDIDENYNFRNLLKVIIFIVKALEEDVIKRFMMLQWM